MPAYHSAKAAWGRLQLGKPVLGMVGPTNRVESIMQIAVSGVHFGGIASIVPDGGVIGALTEPFPPQGTIASPSASCRLAVLRPHKEKRKPPGAAVGISGSSPAKCKPLTLCEDPVGFPCRLVGHTCALRTDSTGLEGGAGAGSLLLRQRDLRVTGDVTQPSPMTGSLDQKQNQFLRLFARIAIKNYLILCVWVVCRDVCVPYVLGADVGQEKMLGPL